MNIKFKVGPTRSGKTQSMIALINNMEQKNAKVLVFASADEYVNATAYEWEVGDPDSFLGIDFERRQGSNILVNIRYKKDTSLSQEIAAKISQALQQGYSVVLESNIDNCMTTDDRNELILSLSSKEIEPTLFFIAQSDKIVDSIKESIDTPLNLEVSYYEIKKD